jgi:hypothetical protein
MNLFIRKEWEAKIREPFWYDAVPGLLEEIAALRLNDYAQSIKLKNTVYTFFEKNLREGKVALGTDGKKWNRDRKPIDTIVIHHSKSSEHLSKERLSAIELIRLYAPTYAKRDKKEPIYSDHNRDGKQVFYPYHWIIRSNGEAERLLFDHEIGWHAGNWDINCRSVAICIDDNHEDTVPDESALRAIARLIREQYPFVSKDHIFGHREINLKTTCPSNHFLNTPEKRGWKSILLEMI